MQIVIEQWNGQGWSFHTFSHTMAEGLEGVALMRRGGAKVRLIIVVDPVAGLGGK